MKINENKIIKISAQEVKTKNPRPANDQSIAYYRDDILNLRNDSYRLKDIVDFLEMNGFKTNISNVSRYLNNNNNNE